MVRGRLAAINGRAGAPAQERPLVDELDAASVAERLKPRGLLPVMPEVEAAVAVIDRSGTYSYGIGVEAQLTQSRGQPFGTIRGRVGALAFGLGTLTFGLGTF